VSHQSLSDRILAYPAILDKYRAAAHYESWYADENERSLNPYNKLHARRRRQSDEEDGLHAAKTNQSESAIQQSIELDRIDENHTSFGPRYAKTMPLYEGGAGPSALEEAPAEEEAEDPNHDSGTGTSQTLVAEEKPRSFRKRLPFIRHRGKDNPGGERTTTSESEKPKQKFTAMSQLRATILNSYINILLIAVPVGIAVNYAKVSPVVVFVVNFIAIVPLAALLSYATEEIALRTGETIGGLLNATFG